MCLRVGVGLCMTSCRQTRKVDSLARSMRACGLVSSPLSSRPSLARVAEGWPDFPSVSGHAGPSLHKDLFLPGCALGLVLMGSMSASERPACPPFCWPTPSWAKLTTWLCSPATRPPAPQASPRRCSASWGRMPLPVFRRTHALCVARDGGMSSLAAPSH